jgi:hypothetical protein
MLPIKLSRKNYNTCVRERGGLLQSLAKKKKNDRLCNLFLRKLFGHCNATTPFDRLYNIGVSKTVYTYVERERET